METVRVEAQRDFIENLCHTKPLTAIAELIWNGLDADAQQVTVEFNYNAMAGIDEIRVIDDGHGIHMNEAKNAFKNLGGSWKKGQNRTKGEKRYLHGKEGKGRFRAFALGKKVTWQTCYQANGEVQRFDITSSLLDPTMFSIGDPTVVKEASTGTTVIVTGSEDPLGTLISDKASQYIAQRFAIYLRQYPKVRIKYGGELIDPTSVEDHVADYDYSYVVEGRDDPIQIKLTVIEWNNIMVRSLMLCDGQGFALQETKPGIQAKGYYFTAYFRSDYFRELHNEGILDVEDISLTLQSVLDTAKKRLREHLRKREANHASTLIDEWKRLEIYPYQGEPLDPVEVAERQVFEVLAVNINEYLPDFGDVEATNKKLTLRLLRHALETRPAALGKILEDVVSLPAGKLVEFAELLEKTSLDAIITASKVVTDRLEFLQGFSTFLFSKDSRRAALERRHLQQILIREPWIFGEKYNLAQQEATLTDVLRRHYDLLGKEDEVREEVERLDGTTGRVDLMFGAVIPYPEQEKRVHLIVELKRPSRQIDGEAMDQAQSYAEAVEGDSRFNMTDTEWEFYVISNDIHTRVMPRIDEPNKPQGLYLAYSKKPIKIWVKTWGQIIQECEARLRFFKERLNYVPNQRAGIVYLQTVHSAHLPAVLKDDEESDAMLTKR